MNAFNAEQTARELAGVSVVSMSFSNFFDMNSENAANYVEPDFDPLFTSPSGHPMTFVVSAGDTKTSISARGVSESLSGDLSQRPGNRLPRGLGLERAGGIATQPAVFGDP